MKNLIMGGAALMSIVAGDSEARADRPIFSNWMPPENIMTVQMHVKWADLVREATDGEIDWEVFVAGALVPPTGTLQAVASGVAQAGHIAPPYQPSEFPIANMVGDMGALQPDDYILAFAYADFSSHEQAAYDEYRNNGVIFGAATVSTPVYNYICRDDVADMAELEGKKVRVPGGGWARFSETIGIVPVSLPGSEIYSSMERGAVDCVAGDITQLSGFNLSEVSKSVLRARLSPAFGAALIAYQPEYWQSITDEQRRAILDQSAVAMVRSQMAYDRAVAASLDLAAENGIAIHDADLAMTAAYDTWVEEGYGGLAESVSLRTGLTNAQEIMEVFAGYVEKWTSLMDGVDRNDEAAIVLVLKTNLHDTLDVSTYGMD